jgi:hypothetical protein
MKRRALGVAKVAPETAGMTLREVGEALRQKTTRLNDLDSAIVQCIKLVEANLRERRPTGHPVDVAFPPWGKLGWSGRRGRWRLVVIDEDECEDLLNMPRLCRADACIALPRLMQRMGVT